MQETTPSSQIRELENIASSTSDESGHLNLSVRFPHSNKASEQYRALNGPFTAQRRNSALTYALEIASELLFEEKRVDGVALCGIVRYKLDQVAKACHPI